MPILPLDHPEPFAATLGVMLYPGEDEASQRRAQAYAAQYLAEPLRLFHEAGHSLAYEDLARIASDSGVPLDDINERWWEGSATGEIFKTLFALAHTDPSLASWGNATKLAEVIAARHRFRGSRTSLYEARARCGSVAHLWGAWCIRERRFQSEPAVGYEGWHDFQFFLAELARDRGKRREEALFRRWGGKPTTLRLRHRNAKNAALVRRYHGKLMELQPDLCLPDANEETARPLEADERYDAAAAFLREQTRDRQRFPLVFEELCSYGFRRNLWGLKPLGLGAVALGLSLTGGAVAAYLRGMMEVALQPVLAGIGLHLLLSLIWVFRITPDWPKPAAYAYADALLAAIERL